MKRTTRSSHLFPDYVIKSITDLDIAILRQENITHIVFDIDSTLVSHGKNILSSEYVEYLRFLTDSGFKLLIGSNTRRDTGNLVESIGASGVFPVRLSMKPRKSFYRRIIAISKTTPDHIAMVGDHILNDIIGSNRSGFVSILVEPVGKKLSLLRRYYISAATKSSDGN